MSKAAELAALIGSQTALSNRNLVINGAMQVAQRGTSATNPGGGYATLDRFRISQNSGGIGNHTQTQSTDVPSGQGFSHSLKLTNTNVKTMGANVTAFIEQKFEGQDLQQLKYGTSSAESVTLSFYVRSSVTGTFCCHLFQKGNDRAHVKEYTISSANTFEKKTLTFTGDTANSLANDNSEELCVSWVLAAGSSAHISADSWTDATSSKGWSTSNQVNWVTTNNATFYITGIQLEVGEQATPFEHRSYADELARCQRYFFAQQAVDGEDYYAFGMGAAENSGTYRGLSRFPVTMRIEPSLTATASDTFFTQGFTPSTNAVTLDQSGRDCAYCTVYGSGGTAGYAGRWLADSTDAAYLFWSSEL